MTEIVGYKGDASKDYAINLSEAKFTYTLKLADGQGATVGALTNDTIGTDAPDGYISIDVGGTLRKIPFWNDD